ncbi:hypothetical protein Q8F55_007770 [Vanrija albida]|uniref:Uncharacterized protein n=1 Tax=Vanrija albida TaxID=181172 RepID=A0ABR3PVD3_9TREE
MNPSPSQLQDTPNPDPIPPTYATVKPDSDSGNSPTGVATPNGDNGASTTTSQPNGATDGIANEAGKAPTTEEAAAVAPSAAAAKSSGGGEDAASTTGIESDDVAAAVTDAASESPAKASSNAIDVGDDVPVKEGEATPAVGSPSVVSATLARVPTPSSRTSTPPLTAAATKKKFSSVSVNKEFLSKAASPVPAPAKLVRPVAAAAPIQSTSSKLLSTKLTTVPSSKPSASPKPAVAQAEAAHNQAILAGLNEFTHLEPNAHRWDEDEDDDVMDFGDGQTYSTREDRRSPDKQDQPVTKSERFGEDFDRSWPRKEADREAAAERARQKARELAERFGDKSASASLKSPPAVAASLPKPPPPPGLGKPAPQVTIASRQRPEQVEAESRPAPGVPQPQEAAAAPADRASSWRRTAPLPEAQSQAKPRRPSSNADLPIEGVPRENRRLQREAPPHGVRDGRLHPPPGLPGLPAAARDAPPHVLAEQTEAPARYKGGVSEYPTAEALASADKLLPKKEPNFDNMLARLQAAMAKARRTPPLPEGNGPDSAGDDISLPQALQSALAAEPTPAVKVAPVPAPHLPFLPPDFFDATQIEPPRSPPPAWRQYAVKLPKSGRPLASIPRWRQRAADNHRQTVIKGWAMSFEPPIEGLHSGTMPLADFLLPQPIGRRFAKHIDTGPIVSISPRSLLAYERKNKRRSTLESRNDGGPVLKGASHAQPSLAEPSRTEPPLLSAPEPVLAKPIPSKDARRFLAGGDGAVGTRLVTAQASADKPAVRFMVSSELDGDSLLDEINKMSLEHIGEADDKRHAQPTEKLEKPRTPPPTVPSVPRNNPTSPGAGQGPWAKSTLAYPVTSPARDVSQHDHIKSVWETSDATTGASAPASAPSQPETPLYPSLSTPSVSNDGSAQAIKTGYTLGQSSSAFAVRSNQGGGYGQFINSGTASPDAGMGAGGMSLQYGIMGRGGGAGAAANGFQQGVWSSPFGTPMAQSTYGYGSGKAALDQQKTMQGYAAKDGAVPYSSEYRYPASQGGVAAGAYPTASGTGGTYNGYPAAAYGARNPQSVYGQVGGYAHNGFGSQTGFGTQMAANSRTGAGRGASAFQNVNGVDYQAMTYDPSAAASGYYPTGAQPNYSPGYSAGGVQQPQGARGAVGRKMW